MHPSVAYAALLFKPSESIMKRTTIIISLLCLLMALPTAVRAQFKLAQPKDIVMYQVNPRVFAPNHSLKAVEGRIDSISALGVNVMWVMPIFPIGVEKTKNSPYCIRDYKAVAPEFGTIDDMKSLVKACHEHGMALIVDWVANHTAWDNPWVKAHPEWYTHKDGKIISPQGPGWDWDDVADLNYDNYYMRKAMIAAMKFWIVEVGIDGFRCDVADGVPTDFWQECIAELRKAAAPRNILMLAEGNNKANLIEGGFDMDYGWKFKDEALKVFKGEKPAYDLFQTDSAEYAGLPQTKVKMRFTTNHDQSTQATPPVEFNTVRGSMAAYVATALLHGGPLIYSSQEVAFPKPINFFHYVPVDWTANPQIYREYQTIIKVFNTNPALRYGTITPVRDKSVFAFARSYNGEDILVVVNTTARKQALTLPGNWQKRKATDLMTGKPYKTSKAIALKPYQYIIIK